MKLRFRTDGQHGDIEALADARRALKKKYSSWERIGTNHLKVERSIVPGRERIPKDFYLEVGC